MENHNDSPESEQELSETGTELSAEDAQALSLRMEALLFVSAKPMSARRLSELLETGGSVIPIRQAAALVAERCHGHAYELKEFGGGYQLMTKPEYEEVVLLLQRQRKAQKLTPGALETLSVIAYKQPITRNELDGIRGVSSDHHIRTLSEHDLIKVVGRTESKGFGNAGAALYGTTNGFLNAFGLKTLSELPTSSDMNTANQAEASAEPSDEEE
ncbi:MAG: SMC-Scp complex subunit ScpB [Planctomycetes bacterium]|nr:SMC-Scp complex subunit ScpB [Planctomycetota bacterium]